MLFYKIWLELLAKNYHRESEVLVNSRPLYIENTFIKLLHSKSLGISRVLLQHTGEIIINMVCYKFVQYLEGNVCINLLHILL